MEYRIPTKLSYTLIGILFGLPVGCLVSLVIIGIAQQPNENPRVFKFGDIIISAIKERYTNNQFAEQLLMTKNGREFLLANKNSLGKVTNLVLANDRDHIILTLEAASEPGKWISAKYGISERGVPIGDVYEDRDFNGRFDTKVKFSRSGKVLSRYIRFYGDWKRVDSFQGQKALSASDTFIFNKDFGWQLDETGKNGGHETMRELPEDE